MTGLRECKVVNMVKKKPVSDELTGGYKNDP